MKIGWEIKHDSPMPDMIIFLGDQEMKDTHASESRNEFEVLPEISPIGIYYSDLYGKFLYGNTMAEEIVEYSKKDLIGKNFLKLELLSPKDLKKSGPVVGHKPAGPEYSNG